MTQAMFSAVLFCLSGIIGANTYFLPPVNANLKIFDETLTLDTHATLEPEDITEAQPRKIPFIPSKESDQNQNSFKISSEKTSMTSQSGDNNGSEELHQTFNEIINNQSEEGDQCYDLPDGDIKRSELAGHECILFFTDPCSDLSKQFEGPKQSSIRSYRLCSNSENGANKLNKRNRRGLYNKEEKQFWCGLFECSQTKHLQPAFNKRVSEAPSPHQAISWDFIPDVNPKNSKGSQYHQALKWAQNQIKTGKISPAELEKLGPLSQKVYDHRDSMVKKYAGQGDTSLNHKTHVNIANTWRIMTESINSRTASKTANKKG